MQNYLDLMKKILTEGFQKSDTISLFGESLEFDLRHGFPLVTSRKINYKAAFAELACFLQGFSDVRQFNKMGVNFWDHDCYKESWSNSPKKYYRYDLGRIYGFQWKFGFEFDQIKALIQNIKSNPESRRHILITYNPKDLEYMCLPPCYVSHQFYVVNNTLNMLVHQRSADYCIGVPFDLASFALFQSLMAKDTGLAAGKLKVVFGDVHIYNAHLDALGEQLNRKEGLPSKLVLSEEASLLNFNPEMAQISGYNPQSPIKYPFQVQG